MEHRSNAILGQSTCPKHACCKDQEIDEAIAKAQAGNPTRECTVLWSKDQLLGCQWCCYHWVFGSNSGYLLQWCCYFHNCQWSYFTSPTCSSHTTIMYLIVCNCGCALGNKNGGKVLHLQVQWQLPFFFGFWWWGGGVEVSYDFKNPLCRWLMDSAIVLEPC